MEKKRSGGLAILVVFYFITWAIDLLTIFSSEKVVYGDYRDITKMYPYLAILVLPILAFGIFNLKELLRKIAIIYEVFNITVMSVMSIATFVVSYEYFMNQNLTSTIVFLSDHLCVPVVIIYFLTRPKVKEQFK